MDDLLHEFTESNIYVLNFFLSGIVVEEKDGTLEFFTCRATVMNCCMGKYLSIVNRKEVKN